MSKPKTKDVTYLVNSKRSLNLQLGGNSYLIPSGRHTIYQLAEKLKVTEADAQKIADHAASTYSVYRPPSGAKERANPPEAWVWFETIEEVITDEKRMELIKEIFGGELPFDYEEEAPAPEPPATSTSGRLNIYQEFDS
jgi:hypothetical protein